MSKSMFRDVLGLRWGHIFYGKDADDLDENGNYSYKTVPTLWEFIYDFVRLRHMNSPHGVWLLIALAFHYVAPLDLSPAGAAAQHGPLSWQFMQQRVPAWMLLVLPYVIFWHAALYFFKMGELPLHDAPYRWRKTIHNAFYNVVGVVTYVMLENLMAWLWATRRMPSLSDAELWKNGGGTLAGAFVLVQLLAVPLFRDAHFFYAHQFLHQGIGGTRGLLFQGAAGASHADKSMYFFVHSLHHRNIRVEPFAGLSMHFVEHLYYFACTPAMLVVFGPANIHPFVYLYCGVHLLLAPAASHSGWAAHWQADPFHQNHHKTFDNNVAGLSAAFLDVYNGSFLGTYVPMLRGRKQKKAGAENKTNIGTVVAEPTAEDVDEQDAKADLLAPISLEQIVYNIVAALAILVPLLYLAGVDGVVRFVNVRLFRGNVALAHAVIPWVLGAGPCVAAFALYQLIVPSAARAGARKGAVTLSIVHDAFNRAVHFAMGPLPIAMLGIYALKQQQ